MPQHPLFPIFAVGGNSRAARSARAKLQWRDRYGRFIEMGRGIKFKVNFGANGGVKSVVGRSVGAIDGETGQVYVRNDPSGLPDGFYKVKSGNAQEYFADLSPEALAKAGIEAGKDVDGNEVGSRIDKDIPTVAELDPTDAPEGWTKGQAKVGGKDVIQTDDGAYRIYYGAAFDKKTGKMGEQWGVEDVQRRPGVMKQYSDIGQAFQQVAHLDDLPEPVGNQAQKQVEAREQNENAINAINDPNVPLADRLKNFDPDGSVKKLIDSGAPGTEVLKKLQENDNWKNVENDLFHPADIRSALQKRRDAEYTKLREEIANLGGNNEPSPEPTNQPDTPEAPAAADAPAGTFDSDTFGLSHEGFLIPTGKRGEDITPAGLANFVDANREYLGEGGKRLVIDTDAGNVEIFNSAPNYDDAKAQAGGIGVDESTIVDLASGKATNPNPEVPNAQDRSADPGEPGQADARTDAPVDNTGDPAARTDNPAQQPDATREPDSADRPAERIDTNKPDNAEAESRDSLERRLQRLNDQFAKVTDDGALNRIENQIAEIEDRLKALDGQDASPKNLEEKVDALSEKIDKLVEAPEADKPAEKPKTPAAQAKPEPAAPAEEPAKPETPTDWAADANNPTREEIANAPEGARINRLHKESDDSQIYEKRGDQWVLLRRDGSESRVKTDGKTFHLQGSTVHFAVDGDNQPVKTPEQPAEAPETPQKDAPKPSTPEEAAGAAIDALADIMANAEDENARLNAATEILDRAGIRRQGDVPAPERRNQAEVDADLQDMRDRLAAPADPNATPIDWSNYDQGTPENDAELSWDMIRRSSINQAQANIDGIQAELDDPNLNPLLRSHLERMRGMWESVRDDLRRIGAADDENAGAAFDRYEREQAAAREAQEVQDNAPSNFARSTPEDQAQRAYEQEAQEVQDNAPTGFGEPSPTAMLEDAPEPVDIAEARRETGREAPAPADAPEDVVRVAFNAPRRKNTGSSKIEVVKNLLETKDIDPEAKAALKRDLASGDKADIERVLEAVRSQPDLPNAQTKPRAPKPEGWQDFGDITAIAEEDDAFAILDPNLIMSDLKARHPNFVELNNNDVVIASRTEGNARYDIIVRRTDDEHFFAYIRRTNTQNGNVQLSKVGGETHSYKALVTKMNRAKVALATGPGSWFNNQRNVENVDDSDLVNYQPRSLEEFLNGLDLPKMKKEGQNAVIRSIAESIARPNVNKAALVQLARDNDIPEKILGAIYDEVARARIGDGKIALDEALRPDERVSHITYGGEQLQAGDFVEWTDWRTTSPTYGQVFRGYVKHLKYKDHNVAGKHAYSDHALVILPEYNRLKGVSPALQRDITSANLRIVNEGDELGEPFFAKKEEKAREQNRVQGGGVREFNVPNQGSETVPREKRPVQTEEVAPDFDDNGQPYIFVEDAAVVVPHGMELLEQAVDGEPFAKPANLLEVGDLIPTLGDGGKVELAKVVGVGKGEKIVNVTLAIPRIGDNGPVFVRRQQIRDNGMQVMGFKPPEAAPSLMIAPERSGDKDAPKQFLDRIERLLNKKQISPDARARVEKQIKQQGIKHDQARILMEDLMNRTDKADRQPGDGQIEKIGRNLAQAMSKIPGFEDDARKLEKALDKYLGMAQDNAFDAEDPYGGYNVRAIPFDRIRANAEFVKLDLNFDMIQVGDLIPRGSGKQRRFVQVLEVQPNGRLIVREIWPERAGGERASQIRAIQVQGQLRDVKRPTHKVRGDYFRPGFDRPIYNPAMKQHARFGTVLDEEGNEKPRNPLTMAMPDTKIVKAVPLLKDLYDSMGRRLDLYNEGFIGIGKNNAGGGIDNIRAQVIKFKDGSLGFVKMLKKKDQVDKEILSARIASTVGFDKIDVAELSDGQTLLGPAIEGYDAGTQPGIFRMIKTNHEANPNVYRMAVLDFLLRNVDRHQFNVRIDEESGDVYPIDHGRVNLDSTKPMNQDGGNTQYDRSGFIELTFGATARNGWMPEFSLVSSAELLRIKAELESMRGEFVSRNRLAWYDNVMNRLDFLLIAVEGIEDVAGMEDEGEDG